MLFFNKIDFLLQILDSVDFDLIHLDGEEIHLGRIYKEHFIENYIKTNLVKR